MGHYYAENIEEVLGALGTTERGLSSAEAADRLKREGPNKIPEAKRDRLIRIFFRQFNSPLIFILLAAAAILWAMGEAVDAGIIFLILLFNAVTGTIQEGRAQNTLLALRKFTTTQATVLRDDREVIIPDEEVVRGDILVLGQGDKVPADARIFLTHNLKADESALTGEQVPVEKTANPVKGDDVRVTGQKDMVFKGTYLVAGSGTAVVIATGLATEIGKISKKIAGIDTEMPLKKNIRFLSRFILFAVLGISAVIFGYGLLRGYSLTFMFAMVVSLSVSIIPEGLPIVITLVLATGVWRMSKRQALVKKLQAVEALGQASIIAVDKTGTLTKNEMIVKKIYADGKTFDVGGDGYEPKGEIALDGKVIDPLSHEELVMAGRIGSFSSDADVVFQDKEKIWKVSGDPTEAAILVFSEKIGFHKEELESEFPRLGDDPFDYKSKYHATANRFEKDVMISVAGAPEVLLGMAAHVWSAGAAKDVTAAAKESFEKTIRELSSKGLRVVAFGFLKVSEKAGEGDSVFKNLGGGKKLTIVGLYGIEDAPRPEAKDAVLEAEAAGMKVVMVTGDHKITARAIAAEVGIYKEGDDVLTGEELATMSDAELAKRIGKATVFARFTPDEKLRIIQAFRSRGEVVAMTGDGVNDAPPLVAADLGVAMGKIGTEVAKEAADIVVLDDNFKSIIAAAEEGRNIYVTIRKVVLYLFSTSLGEVFTIMGALFLGFPVPVTPVQIIWLNFVTDGFLDVSLAMEPKENGLLKRKFSHPKKYLVDRLMAFRMILMSLVMTAGALFLFKDYFLFDDVRARTAALTVLAVFQWFNAWNCRSSDRSIFGKGFFANKFLLASTFLIAILQVLAVYNPFFQSFLGTTALGWGDWLIIVDVALSIVIVEELRKSIVRFFARRKNRTIAALG